MSKLFQVIKFEFHSNILEKKWKYLIPAAIAFHNSMVGWHLSKGAWGLPEYIGDFLKGMPTVRAGGGDFLLPGGWLAFFVLLLYYNGKTARDFMSGVGQQVLLRTKHAEQFWLAKWISCVCSTVIWFFAAYAAIVLFCAILSGNMEKFLDGFEKFGGKQLCTQLILPVLASCVMEIWQLVISMWSSSVLGLLGACSCLFVSAYFTKWFLPGNYLMKLRIEEMLACGDRSIWMLFYLIALSGAGILTGRKIMKKMDYLTIRSDI